jgi:hypothetical protein
MKNNIEFNMYKKLASIKIIYKKQLSMIDII